MKRSTIVLVALFAAAFAYYFLAVRSAKAPEEAAQEAKKLFKVKPEEIVSVKITQPGGSVTLERGDRDAWLMTEPLRARADRAVADAAASAIANLSQQRVLGAEGDAKALEEMGFTQPRARVEYIVGPAPAAAPPASSATDREASGKAGPAGARAGAAAGTASTSGSSASRSTTGGAAAGAGSGAASGAPGGTGASSAGAAGPIAFEFGSAVPATSSAFLRIVGKNEIYLVPEALAAPFTKAAEEYRDRALLDMTILDVGEARISRPEGDLLFRRRGDAWWVESPYEDMAEGSAVQSLLSALIALRAEKFLDTTQPGLETAPVTVRMLSAAGEALATLHVGASPPGDPAKRYVRAESPGTAGTIDAIVSLGPSLDLSQAAAAFRAKKALPFHSWDATGLKLTSRSTTLSFVKKEGIWSAASPAGLSVDAAAVEDTVRAVSDLDVVSYDADKTAPAARLGLDPPAARIEISFGGEAGKPKALLLGSPAGAAGSVYAKASDRPGVMIVPSAILERIAGGAALYTEKTPVPSQAPGTKAQGAAPANPPSTGSNGPH